MFWPQVDHAACLPQGPGPSFLSIVSRLQVCFPSPGRGTLFGKQPAEGGTDLTWRQGLAWMCWALGPLGRGPGSEPMALVSRDWAPGSLRHGPDGIP